MEESTGLDIPLGADGHIEIAFGPRPAQLLQPFGHPGAGVLIIAMLVDAALGQHEHKDARQNDEAEVQIVLPGVQLPRGEAAAGKPVAEEFIHTMPPCAERSFSRFYIKIAYLLQKIKGEK